MRRLLKIGLWAVAAIVSLALLLACALYIAGNTDCGRVVLEKLTYRLTSGRVSLSGMSGSFPGQLNFERLELGDIRGVWLRAQNVSLGWSPLALLAGHVRVAALHADSVDLQRLPEPTPRTHASKPASIPNIDVSSLTVDLLQLEPELAGSSASLVLHGSAHLRSLQDMVIDAAANRTNGDGNYQLQVRFDPARMDATLSLHEPASGPLENLLQLPGLGALSATITLRGPRGAELLDLAVDAGTFHGKAQGQFNFPQRSAELEFAFNSPALAPRPDLAWQGLAVHGHWHGNIKAPKADGQIEVDKLQLPGGTALAHLDGEVTADAGQAALHAMLDGLQIPGSHPQLLAGSPVSIDAMLRLDTAAHPLDVTVSHRLFVLHGSGETVAASGGKRSSVLELRLPDLAPLAALAGQGVRGNALLKAQLQIQSTSTQFSLNGSAALAGGSESWSGVIGDHPTFQVSGAINERAISLERLALIGRALSLTGTGELSRATPGLRQQTPATLQAKWDLAVSDLRLLSPALAGTLKASGKLDGPTSDFAGSARLASTVSVRGSPSGTLSADISASNLPSAPSGTLIAQGSLDGAPLHIDAALERNPAGALRMLIHRAEWKSLHADGDLTVASVAAQSHGQLNLQIQRLADFQHLLGTDIDGRVTGTLALHAEQGKTRAQLTVDVNDLALGSLRANAQLTAHGASDAVEFDLALQVPELQGVPANLSANGSANFEASRVSLAKATANYRGQDVHLLSPAVISWAGGVAIESLQLGAQQAVLELKGKLSPALDMNASFRQVRPALVNVFAPGLLASGTIEGSAQLTGAFGAPTGQVQITATGLTLSDASVYGMPPLHVRASARLAGERADVDASLEAGTRSHLSVTGQAPLRAGGQLDLKVAGSLDVAMFNPLLEARGQQAAGEVNVDATVGGNLAGPQIGGTVKLVKASLQDYGRGLGLTDINASMVGSEGTLQIQSLTATAGPGTVSMSGTVGVLQPGVPLTLHITARHAQPIASKLVTSNLDANLNLSGKARERLDLSGTVDLGRTIIGIPNRLPPNVAVLDVRRRGAAAPVQAAKPLVVGLDLAIKAPQEFLVQGRGLDAEMGGSMHLSGTTDIPLVTGGFDLQRGSVSVGGSRLSFTAGRVSFNGAGLKSSIDPTLDFAAQSTVGGVTATLHITGLADAPQFEFTSNPPQPPDEIMALLLFGTPAAQLSALQLAQVGATLAIMSGAGGDGGLNPLVKLQQSFGLDRLTVGAAASTSTTTESSGASIAAGRYVAKRIYIEAKQSTTGTSQVEADVDLTKHLKLQTRLGNGTASVQGTTPENDPGSSVGLTYQIDY